jgi:hypothetical protein
MARTLNFEQLTQRKANARQTLLDGGMVKEQPQILCPNCGKPMQLTDVRSAVGALPELWHFECGGCDEIKAATKSEIVGRRLQERAA